MNGIGDKNASLPDNTGATGQKITLLELFQSQSCDSCPPANETLINFVSKPGAEASYLLLTYHVTYWNHLSWRDTFSYQDFDVRQREYVRRRGNPQGVYTPMLIVNGRSMGVGNTKEAVTRLIAEGRPEDSNSGPFPKGQAKLGVETNQYGERVVNVDASTLSSEMGEGDLHIWVIRYTHSPKDVLVTRGENAGRTLRHRNVVTSLTRIGYLQRGCVKPYTLPPNDKPNGEGRAVVVQDGTGGEIMDVIVL
ncbi:uncharacterized protein A1O9_07160 [Exophiala aquamarina CBS 119918]|uniref:DUF1223-domain-containing protein n=1 Tax=Exophiala aquamarina CBS 119918 TaxID=1182545 RepID=A0A072PN54_9EURO|nr:uncharacterized protein A1O9_07160 [Exophiala aquamarina CBS 119918]KEF56970.1 hypothetical protein A1O9_07160 [Exophiala aquamarina CBS 119918]